MNALVANLAIGKQAWDVQILMVDTDVIVSKATITKKMTHAKISMNAKAKTHVIQKVLSVRTWRALTGVIAYQASLCHRMENVVSLVRAPHLSSQMAASCFPLVVQNKILIHIMMFVEFHAQLVIE